MPDLPRVLFLCTGNSCRSQMAEAFAAHHHSDRLRSFSAGTHPKGVDPRAQAVMQEAGVPLTNATSKSLDDTGLDFDLVITVCSDAHENCPVFPGQARVVHHGFDDPPRLAAGVTDPDEAMGHYRRVRDEIQAFVRGELPGLLSA